MKRALLVVLLGACLGAGTPPAAARTCTLDVVPAATLLLPYFEVDLANASGRTTLFSVNNAKAGMTLAHVVLWTDLGVPTLAFDVYLTGYDVQTINLRDVFAGQLPQTASRNQDPGDRISPQGALSQDSTYATCTGLLPPPPLSPTVVDHLRRVHQGLPSPLLEGKCAAVPRRDGVARGYVTVDVVHGCSSLNPLHAEYFQTWLAHDNVLWGDFFLIDPAGNLAQGENLVRIESDRARFAGKPTFYERYVNGTGADGREPLPTVWASRFIKGGGFTGGTELIYWRDSRRRGEAFQCGTLPAGFPALYEDRRIFVFDEEENADSLSCQIFIPTNPCPSPFGVESGRLSTHGADLTAPFDFGWWYFDMKDRPAPARTQAWLGTIHNAQGRFSVGLEAEPLDSGCAPLTSNPASN